MPASRSCGFRCYPATFPGNDVDPFDCEHLADQHYSIDGEAVGCIVCAEGRDVDPCPCFTMVSEPTWCPLHERMWSKDTKITFPEME